MIKLSLPEIGEEELEEIKKVLESGWLIQGEKVYEFEQMVQNYLGIKHAIAVSSGTAALHLSLLALNIRQNDEVIVPDFTFPATANVVEIVGGNCRFVDIDLDTFNIDTEKIEENITEKTKAIIVVHEFGCPAQMDKIMEIAKKYNLKVIEDAACALGTEYKGKKVGTFGDVGCFSLHPRKNITTGEGGIIVTNDDEIAERLRMLRNHGMKNTNGKIQFELPGLNYRLTNIQGAIGVVQMKKLEQIIEKRTQIAKLYNELLKDIEWIKLPTEPIYGRHVWQTYHIVLDQKINRDDLIKFMKDNSIEANIGAYAVHREPYYKNKYKLQDEKYRSSLIAAGKGMALPIYSKLSLQDIEYIVNTIKSFNRGE